MADNKESFPEKTYKHFLPEGFLKYPVPQMEMIKEKLKHGAEENQKELNQDNLE